ncbi:alkylhydroperoxidase [Actinotalea ferrariae CF5-4]|uniref:Alkylhydroperoxidase n=2 Tax=Actinotalea TaxID=458839 RepID=A0A021VVX3_9CELL|nr:alkylhydroperoxidase [Actinotalea ferrariae CF5-4]
MPDMYPPATPEVAARRRELAPEINEAWDRFSSAVFAAGALDEVTKQLIAVAVAHVTQCPYCITGHTRVARRRGASDEQIMESIWVAAEMRAGGAYAHSTLALGVLDEHGAGHAHAHRAEAFATAMDGSAGA